MLTAASVGCYVVWQGLCVLWRPMAKLLIPFIFGLVGAAAAFVKPSSVRFGRWSPIMNEGGKGFGKGKTNGDEDPQLLYYHQKKEAGVAEMLRFNRPQQVKPPSAAGSVGGKAPRVFERTVSFPTLFEIKVIGEPGEGGGTEFEADIVKVVAECCGKPWQDIAYSSRDTSSGKYRSLTIQAPVANADELYSIYESISEDKRVKFKF